MTPLSHTTPAATEQAGDTVEPMIANLPDELFAANIFPYLESGNLSHVGQVCRRFNVLSRAVWQRRAREIYRACAELWPPFGSTPLGPNPSPAEAASFLDRTVQRVREIQNSLPEDLRSQFSADDLVCKVDPGYMQEFLQKAYDHSLRTVFGELAHVPAGISLEESVRRIRDWLHTSEAGTIQELSLGRRGLCCLPREVGRLTALRYLDLRDNRLASLPPEIGRLTALQELDLFSNQLTSLPSEFGRLTALRNLYLCRNHLTSLPSEFGRLTELRDLCLCRNQLAPLPPEIGQLTALQALDLHLNRLASLPPEIGRLTSLRELHLHGNQLTSLPPEIGRLTELQCLGLPDNRLASLPPELGRLTALRELCLYGNQLTSLPPELGQLRALKRLLLVDGHPLFWPFRRRLVS